MGWGGSFLGLKPQALCLTPLRGWDTAPVDLAEPIPFPPEKLLLSENRSLMKISSPISIPAIFCRFPHSYRTVEAGRPLLPIEGSGADAVREAFS
jgi:hypothetical protein